MGDSRYGRGMPDDMGGRPRVSKHHRVPSPPAPPQPTSSRARYVMRPSPPPIHRRRLSDNTEGSQYEWRDEWPASASRDEFLRAPPHHQHGGSEQLRRSNSDRGPRRPRMASRSRSPAHSHSPGTADDDPSPSSSLLGETVYQYVPLSEGEIRLVRVFPVRKTAIRCDIVHASLADPPPYVAVSYAWGDPGGEMKKIEVAGSSVDVSVSLHGALQALRKRDVSVMVWVDALSIDQRNKTERAQQVQLMRSIYYKADSVAVWLGPEEDNSARAVDFIAHIAKLDKQQQQQHKSQVDDRRAMARILSSRDSVDDLAAVVSLFERPYWRRLWVVQEVFNAKKVLVYCGDTIAPWDVYQTASALFHRHRADIFDMTSLMGSYYQHHSSSSSLSSPDLLSPDQVLIYQGPASLPDLASFVDKREGALLDVLCACRRKLSSDPRDKLYGILGVLHPEIRKEFRPDYDLSVREVYTDVVDYLLTTTGRLDVVCESIHFPPHTSSAGLPSFVPDWSHIPQVTSMGRKYNFRAAGSTRAACKFDDDRLSKLEMSAVPLDTVDTKGVAVGTMCNVGDYLMAFLHWRALLLENIAPEADDVRQRVQEDFAATLSLGQIPSTHTKQSRWLAACYSVFGNLIRKRLPYLSLDRSLDKYLDLRVDIEPDERRQFLQKHFGEMMMGRCFFITHNNYLGMGTGFMLPGDDVVVPLGCSTPILLRQEGTRGEYRYVGDAYVHGYMNGKAVEQLSSGTREVRKYILH